MPSAQSSGDNFVVKLPLLINATFSELMRHTGFELLASTMNIHFSIHSSLKQFSSTFILIEPAMLLVLPLPLCFDVMAEQGKQTIWLAQLNITIVIDWNIVHSHNCWKKCSIKMTYSHELIRDYSQVRTEPSLGPPFGYTCTIGVFCNNPLTYYSTNSTALYKLS